MMDEVSRVTSTAFERHAQTALVLILVALLLWVGNTTQKTALIVAEMRVEVAYLKAATTVPSEQLTEMSKRIDTCQKQVDRLEARAHGEEG